MTEDSIALWRAAGRLRWGVERMTRFRPPDALEVPEEPVLYVEALTAPLFAEAFGVTLADPSYDWLPRLPVEYRRRDVSLMTLGDARKLPGPRFIKPPRRDPFDRSTPSPGTPGEGGGEGFAGECRTMNAGCRIEDKDGVVSHS